MVDIDISRKEQIVWMKIYNNMLDHFGNDVFRRVCSVLVYEDAESRSFFHVKIELYVSKNKEFRSIIYAIVDKSTMKITDYYIPKDVVGLNVTSLNRGLVSLIDSLYTLPYLVRMILFTDNENDRSHRVMVGDEFGVTIKFK